MARMLFYRKLVFGLESPKISFLDRLEGLGLYTFKRHMVAACHIIVTDLCPRLRARLTCNTSIVHESQGRE